MNIAKIEVRPRAKKENTAALSVRVLGDQNRLIPGLTIGVTIDATHDEVGQGVGPGGISDEAKQKALLEAMSIASQFANADLEELKKLTVVVEGGDDVWPRKLAMLVESGEDAWPRAGEDDVWPLKGRGDDWP